MRDTAQFVGSQFAGKFFIDEVVAESDHAAVFRATDHLLRRAVALKVIRIDDGARELDSEDARDRAVERLHREAIALAHIAHPNLPTVFEAGFDEATHCHFVVLEWVPGEPLSAFVRVPASEDQVIRLAHDIAAGCAAAHRKGILHRDLRPQNILVTTDDKGSAVAKLLDFGVAQFDEGYDMTRLTAPDEVMGSFHYISPEQARGEPVDTRTDVYAFGTVLFELVCGHLPFVGTPMQVVAAHIEGRRPRMKAKPGLDLSPLVKALLKRCMELDPDQRFPDCTKVHEVLSNIRRERPPTNPRAIHAVAVDQPAHHLVVGRADGSVDVFDQHTGQSLMRFDAHRGPVTALTFRPDTQEFLSAGEDGHIHLWSISEQCRAGTWPGLRGQKATLEFSPFGYIFASGEPDGRIRLWSLLEQRPLGELEAHAGAVSALHFLPEGRFLASGGHDGTLRLWDVGSMELAEHCAWDRGPVSHLAMHVRDRFVVAFQDGSMAMGRWNKDEPIWHRRVHGRPVTRLFEQSGGQGVFSVSLDGRIECVDVFDGDARRQPILHLEGIRAAALHAGSERLFAASDSVLVCWTWSPAGEPRLEGYLPEDGRSGWMVPEA